VTRNCIERPILLLVMGTPGAGKSTVAKSLLKFYNLVYLDNNFIADNISNVSRVDEDYRRLRKIVYDSLYRIAMENLKVGNSVLVDAPHVTHMRSQDWRAEISSLAIENGAALKIVRCYCSEEILKRRIEARGEPRDRWKLDHWSQFMEQEPLMVDIPLPHIDLNTEFTADKNRLKIMEYMSASNSKTESS
jgi:predicted kinase